MNWYWFTVPALALLAWGVAWLIAHDRPDSHCCWHCNARAGKPHTRGCPTEVYPSNTPAPD